MKVWIDADEWWPVFGISRTELSYGTPVELSDGIVERIEQVTLEFKSVQSLLFEAEDEAKRARARA